MFQALEKKGIMNKFLLCTIVYAGGILWFSLQPDLSGASHNPWGEIVRNFLHIPAYAGLAGLLMLTSGELWEGIVRRKFKKVAVYVFVISVVYGLFNELVQFNVLGRVMSTMDMFSNAVGAFIGIWLMGMLIKKNN